MILSGDVHLGQKQKNTKSFFKQTKERATKLKQFLDAVIIKNYKIV
jgi:hypothetical protein